MANLNLSLVLKADASGFKGELREAGGALRGFGTDASKSVAAAQTVVGRLRAQGGQIVSAVQGSLGRLGQLAQQASDVAVGLGSGQGLGTVILQQGTQIASIFGPTGAVVGAGVALVALGAKFITFKEDAGESVRAAAEAIEASIKSINASLGSGLTSAEKIIKEFEGLPSALRGLDILRQDRTLRELTQDAEAAGDAIEKVLGELGRAAGPTSTELWRWSAAAASRSGWSGARGAGGSRGVPGRDDHRYRAVAPARGGRRRGGRRGPDADRRSGRGLRGATAHAEQSIRDLEAAGGSIRSLADGVETEGGRILSQLRGIDQATEDTGNAFLDLYNRVVGQSYVPDLVTEAGGWFDRLKSDMTTSTGEATSAVAEAFAGLDRQVSYRLGSMIAHNKLALTDFASFAQDVLGQILGGLIGAGINAGIGSLFAPATAGATFNPATATGPEVLHAGGIVGAPGNPRRGGVPWAAFLGADRYHRGGIAGLRPGEVPVIAMRGERITPAGQAAGGSMTVVINDQRRGGVAIETRERRGAGGDRILEVTIRDTMSRSLARGEQDAAMAARFGLRPGLAGR